MQEYAADGYSDSYDPYAAEEEVYEEEYDPEADDGYDPGADQGYEQGFDAGLEEAYYADAPPPQGRLPSPAALFTNGPGPVMIVVAAIVMCLIMAVSLLAVSSGITLSTVAEIAPALATQVAAPGAAQAPTSADDTAVEIPADCAVSDLFPNKVRRWCGLITQYAGKHELAPDLVAALIWLESGGDPGAYSRSGAVGLMQIMPSDGLAASFTCVNGPCFSDRPTSAELEDPEFNIAYGTRMLAGLVRKNGDLREALKSYGPMDAGYSYADKVIGIFQQHTK